MVSKEMRSRLLMNRHGKLTSDQWKDMVTDPIVKLLLLLVPIILFFGPFAARLTFRAWWIILIALILVLGLPLILRARRYARAPLQFAQLYSGSSPLSPWMFWRPYTFFTAAGEPLRFGKRLAPFTLLKPDHLYLVYYLEDPGDRVLLSLAPADEAAEWQPSEHFYARQARRGR